MQRAIDTSRMARALTSAIKKPMTPQWRLQCDRDAIARVVESREPLAAAYRALPDHDVRLIADVERVENCMPEHRQVIVHALRQGDW